MTDFRILPKEYRFSHDFCFFLHDQLVSTLKAAEEASLFDINFDLKDPAQAAEISNLSGEDLFKWMMSNGYKDQARIMTFQQLCAALSADFLHFVCESLKCMEKGKHTVGYALLRKPFKENLFFLEWMLARPADFLERFDSSDLKRFKFPHPKEGEKNEHEQIIHEATEKVRGGPFFPSELIHEFRFKKESNAGLESAWQKANHLVTTFKHMETEEGNLNFIFSDSDAHQSQWGHYYSSTPLILYHAVGVIYGVFEMFVELDDQAIDLLPLRNSVGLNLYFSDGPWGESMKAVRELLRDSLTETGLDCPHCGKAFEFDEGNLRSFYERAALNCSTGCPEVILDDEATWGE